MYAELKTNRRLKNALPTSEAFVLLRPGSDTPGGFTSLFARHRAQIILNDLSPSPVVA